MAGRAQYFRLSYFVVDGAQMKSNRGNFMQNEAKQQRLGPKYVMQILNA